jgi:hypothetical protein
MSEQIQTYEIARENILMDVPQARQTHNVHDQSTTLEWDFVCPPGWKLDGIIVDARATPTATGTGTATISELIRRLKGFQVNRGGDPVQVMDVDNNNLDLTSILLSALEKPGEVAGRSTVARDPTVAASATAYYGKWHIPAKLPGREFKFALEIGKASSVLSGLTLTALSASYNITALYTDSKNRQTYTVYGIRAENVNSVRYKHAMTMGLVIDNVEWSGRASSLSYGSYNFTSEMFIQQESITNDILRGFTSDSSDSTMYTAPIQNLKTGNKACALLLGSDRLSDVYAQFNAQTNLDGIILSDLPTNKVKA